MLAAVENAILLMDHFSLNVRGGESAPHAESTKPQGQSESPAGRQRMTVNLHARDDFGKGDIGHQRPQQERTF
jgi:hypothetical protein